MEQRKKDGTMGYKKAEATGFDFYKMKHPEAVKDEGDTTQALSEVLESDFTDSSSHLMIDFERTYTRYTRFNGRSLDENLEFNDVVSVLIPSQPQTTNCLLFQLVRLEDEVHLKDYTVGWGVFPIVDSQFNVNEGKFKVPMVFGNVDPTLDMFQSIEK